MLTLPNAILAVLIPFATLFSTPTWRKAQVLLVGTILTPGQRTVAAALLSHRAAHPLGAPPHSASPPALALGNPVQSRPGPAASHSIPSRTAPLVPEPLTGQPKIPDEAALSPD